MNLRDIFRYDRTWTAISAIASAIAAIFACIAVFQTGSIFDAERDAKRPYFSIKRTFMDKDIENDKYKFEIVFKNVGVNPAVDPSFKMVVRNHSFSSTLFGVAYAFADEIAQEADLCFFRENIETKKSDENWYFVFIAIRYSDPISKKEYAQLFFQQYRAKSTTLERILVPQRNEILKDQDIKLPLTDENIIKQIWRD